MRERARLNHRLRALRLLEVETDDDLEREIARRRAESLQFPKTEEEREMVERARTGVRHGRSTSRRSIAFHEAAHLTMAWIEGVEPRGAVILADGTGHAWIEAGARWPTTADVAGAVAERIAGHEGADLSDSDRKGARATMAAAGMGGRTAAEWLGRAEHVARRHLRINWRAVEAVAAHLLREGWIGHRAAVELIEMAGARRA